MNKEQANAIDLSSILRNMGYTPSKQSGVDLHYLSPLRDEKTASFHVNTSKNVWHDFGEGIGGTVVNFICLYLQRNNEDHTLADALRYLKNMHAFAPIEPSIKNYTFNKEPCLEIRSVTSLQHPLLIKYLEERNIRTTLAKKFLKEIFVQNSNTGNAFYALGFPNENGGYEVRNNIFKGSIAPKSISFVRGSIVTPKDIHVFEGFMDFLSALSNQTRHQFEGDAIILNSAAQLSLAYPYIRNYGYETLYSWLDNDIAGKKASEDLQRFAEEEANLFFKPMNKFYAPHKDVNEWHMNK